MSDEALGLSFFDNSISINTKKEMVKALKINGLNKKRVIAKPELIQKIYKSQELCDFVTINTLKFFERFEISTDFLSSDPMTWTDRVDYNDGLQVCRGIQVVNDTAERAVQMFTNYNRTGTKNENNMQFLLQAVNDYNKKYPSYNKSKLN